LGAIVQFVSELVHGFLELEDRKQLLKRRAGWDERRIDGRVVAGQELIASAMLEVR